MSKIEAAFDPRRMREAGTAVAAAGVESGRGLVRQARRRAEEIAARAQARARDEVARRRLAAAGTLETLAEALRPQDLQADSRARRRKAAVVGGSGLALTLALGAGVALGLALSRKLRKKAEAQPAAQLAPQEGVQSATYGEEVYPLDAEPSAAPERGGAPAEGRLDS